jgi:hypothetical protein
VQAVRVKVLFMAVQGAAVAAVALVAAQAGLMGMLKVAAVQQVL